MVVSGKNLFAGAYFGGIFCSTDNGTSWTAVNNGLTNPEVFSLAVSGTNLFAGTYGEGVFLSTNNGLSWTEARIGFTNDPVNCLAVSGTSLFAGTWEGSVFLSTNNGTNWSAVNTGLLTNNRVWTLAVFGTNLFAGTGNGLWQRPLSEMIPTSVEQLSAQLPEKFSLSQNYPNPFNPSTTLRYSVPERSNVRLSIFNTLGQTISEIVNGTKEAGYYAHSFNASQFSSGIYFYRIEVTSTQNSGKTFVETKKMVLMR
jgi:hypothetical protein